MSDPTYFRFDEGGTAISAAHPLPVTGTGGGAATIADGADVAEGATTATAYADATGAANGTVVGLLKGLFKGMLATGANAQNVQGNVAHDAVDSGSPLKIGGYASTAVPAAVSAADRVNAWYFLNGQAATALVSSTGTASVISTSAADAVATNLGLLYAFSFNACLNGAGTWDRQRGDANGTVNQPYAMTGSRWLYAAASGGIVNTTTAVTLAAAAGANIRNYLTSLQVFAGTLGAGTEIAIRDGAGGTVLWRGSIGTGGLNETFTFPVPLKGTANTLMEVVTLTATITGAVYVNAQGFTGA